MASVQHPWDTISRAARWIMALLKYFRPALPTKVSFLAEREVQEANADVKEVLEGDKLGKGGFNLVDSLSRPPNFFKKKPFG